jgi:hypothetical protein
LATLRCERAVIAWVGAIAAFTSPVVNREAAAKVVVLGDQNALIQVGAQSDSGFWRWDVDGVSQLYEQGFWYRVGTGIGESPVGNLLQASLSATDTNGDSVLDQVAVTYRDPNDAFEIVVTVLLRGYRSGSNCSSMYQCVTLSNLSAEPLDMHLFQYTDFDLNGTDLGQAGTLVPKDLSLVANQDSSGLIVARSLVSPLPSHWEIGTYPTIRSKMVNACDLDTVLIDNTTISGDVTWAFQWDLAMAPGASSTIALRHEISPIPEPGSVLLMILAVPLLSRRGRRAA